MVRLIISLIFFPKSFILILTLHFGIRFNIIKIIIFLYIQILNLFLSLNIFFVYLRRLIGMKKVPLTWAATTSRTSKSAAVLSSFSLSLLEIAHARKPKAPPSSFLSLFPAGSMGRSVRDRWTRTCLFLPPDDN